VAIHNQNSAFWKKRAEIEEEILARQDKWRNVSIQTSVTPPEEPPPPTRM
jgi:hypothetical protein